MNHETPTSRTLSRSNRKRWLLAVVLLMGAGFALQPLLATRLDVVPSRADAKFELGETVTFSLRPREWSFLSQRGTLRCTVTDDQGAVEKYDFNLSNPAVATTVKIVASEPGFLRCDATWEDGSELDRKRSVVAVAPDAIQPRSQEPPDFDDFWDRQLERLRRFPADASFREVASGHRRVEAFDVRVACIGENVSGYFARPNRAEPRSLPAVLCVHGAGVRSASLKQAVEHAGHDRICIDINAHGIPNGQSDEFYEELANTTLKGYQFFGANNPESCYFLGMYLRAKRALDFLADQPEWDRRRLIVTGNSQGGSQAIAAAALDDRVTMIAIGVPALADQDSPFCGWPRLSVSSDGSIDERRRITGGYFDTVFFASRVSADVICSVGYLDTTCPPNSVYAAFNQFSGNKQMIDDPRTGHAVPYQTKQALRQAITHHIHSRESP